MAEVQEYKCPCCGGAIEFNSSIQKLKCPYCETEFELETLANYDKELSGEDNDEMEWNMESAQEWTEGEEEGMRVYVCKSCGGEIVADENTAASACPYCDNPIVLLKSVAGELKPEYIIPFKLDKKDAKAKFKEHLEGKKLLPKVFKTQNHLEEIKGIYVPYWIFDSKADAKLRYRASKVRHWSDAKNYYTETSYYSVLREGNIAFANVPVDGSSKIPDDMTESLEPFDSKDAVPFQTAYFAGYMADKYDVDKEKAVTRANDRVKKSTQDSFRSTVKGYQTVEYEGGNIKLVDGKASYVMYPVWILTTKWKGELYTFAMNGQTGKFVGNLPVDKSIANKILFRTAGIIAVILFIIQSLFYFL